MGKLTMKIALVGLLSVLCVQGEGEIQDDIGDVDTLDFHPLEEKVLDRLITEDDGPVERKIKKLIAEYLLATVVVDSVSNATSDSAELATGRALLQGNYYPAPPPQQQQQQPQVVYVYGTTPPPSNQRTRRTKPTRTTRTRRPSHHHQSSEERRRTTQPPQQPIYVQQPQPGYPYPPQQQQPPYNPQYPPQQQQQPPQYPQYPAQPQPVYQPQRPVDLPQDSLAGQVPGGQPSSPSSSIPVGSPPRSPYAPLNSTSPIQSPVPNQPQTPPQYQQPYPPQQSYPAQPQQPQPPVQVVYLEPTTPVGQTPAPTTTPRPRPSQEHVYNQVNKILDNVATGNITGIVDQALGIRAPMPTRNFVNGILNTVFCSPINRLLGRCRGPSQVA